MSAAQTRGALDGVKVLDLSSVFMGPMASQHLGDMGAEVIKVEAPEGDLTRAIGPFRSPKMGAVFLSYNRNKRSVVLDLKRPEAREVLHRLVRQADVVLHSIRNPAAAGLGLSYDALRAVNPAVIYCHLKGFADGGEYQDQAAFDDIIQALSGLAMLQTAVASEARYVPSAIADKICGIHAAYALSIALLHKFRTGEGQEVKLSMFETMAAFNLSEHQWGHVFDPPLAGMGYPSVRAGLRRPCATSDGYIAFLPYSDKQWKAFFRLVDRPELAEGEFGTFAGRQKHWKELYGFINTEFTQRTTDEWMTALKDLDIPMSRVNDLEALETDPHLAAVGFWETLQHPTEGLLRFPANPLGLMGSPPAVRRMAPHLGEHTREVLAEHGFSSEEIARLLDGGVAAQHVAAGEAP
ncbi:MAG: CoA transferase [Comamonadaceae bacterium]|nr:MAG: CoA transferase [Comamonadaceae bacterium]